MGMSLTFVFDQSFHYGPVAADLAEQVIEQGCFSQRAGEQLFGGMWFSAQLPHHRFNSLHQNRHTTLSTNTLSVAFTLMPSSCRSMA